MIKFKTWLESHPGMTQRLQAALSEQPFHVNATCVPNVKSGRRLMPMRWMPVVVALSEGHFTLEELIDMRLRLRYAKQ